MKKSEVTIALAFGLLVFIVALQSCRQQNEQSSETPASEVDSTVVNIPWSEESEMLGLGVPYGGDLDSLVKRRIIRALVPYSRTYYHIDGKGRSGMAFEALNAFEQYVNKQLGFSTPQVRVVFIPVSHDQLIKMLAEGYGDLALGGITILEERKSLVDFSTPTQSGIKQVVVGGPGSVPLRNLAALSGKPVYIYKNGSYAQSLRKLNDSLEHVMLPPVQVQPVDEYLSVDDILEMVATGHLPYTIAEADVAHHWASQWDSLKVYDDLVVRSNSAYGCAVRKETPKLLALVNKFLKTHRKGTEYGNVLYSRYLGTKKQASRLRPKVSPETIHKLQGHFVEYAGRYQLDWLLLMAQGYQESRLDNTVVSSAGAVGIMQVKPSTAAGAPINIRNVHKLENNIHAGAKYDRHLIDHYFQDEPMDDLNKQLFALAAYNAGPSRIAHLRKVAQSKRLNHNVWFNHVEKVVAHEVGRETVQYVSNIYKYYTSLSALRAYEQSSGKPIWPTGKNP
jgi:membrane-bound lytic murein transglycosylase MltF